MGRRARLVCLWTAACVAAGCQSPPAETARPVAAAPTTVPAVPPPLPPAAAAPAAAPLADASSAAGRADVAAKLAESQIRSIDEMLAARAAKADGVTLIPPSHGPAAGASGGSPAESPAPKSAGATAGSPPAGSQSAGSPSAASPSTASDVTAPPAVPSAAEAFRAVPSIGGQSAADAVANTPVPNTPASASNSPAAAPARPAPTDPLDRRLSQRATDYPHDLAAQLDVQLLRFLNDEPVPGGDALAGLDVEDRGLLSGLLDGLSNFRTAVRTSPNLLMTRKIRPIVEMADRLRGQADLSIPVAVLCRSAPGFGKYTPIEPARLQAGVDYKPVLYYEIENFSQRLDEKNQWTAAMQEDVVLYDRAGRAKWQRPRQLIRDTCRSRRHDFFMAYPVTLPTNLEPGEYTLKVTLIDPAAGRVAETGVKITIVPKVDPVR